MRLIVTQMFPQCTVKHEDKNELEEMCDKLGVPRMVADRANSLFKKFMERKSVKCGNNDAVSAACLLLACRQEEVPRTFKEICSVSKVAKKKIGRMLKTEYVVSRFCSKLNLPLACLF